MENPYNLQQIISTVELKGINKKDDKKGKLILIYEYGDPNDPHPKVRNHLDATNASLEFMWRRGTGYHGWREESDFSTWEWNMMKNSGGTIYICLSGEDYHSFCRYTKETKVRLPKVPKAPNVKINYAKDMIGLKNGMEFRYLLSDCHTGWIKIPQKDKAGVKDLYFMSEEMDGNGNYIDENATKKTTNDIASIRCDQILDALKTTKLLGAGTVPIVPQPDEEIRLEVRTQATDKKFMSKSTIISFRAPKAGPEAKENLSFTYTKANKAKKTKAEFKIDFSQILTKVLAEDYTKYEYILAPKAADLDWDKQKWTKLPSSGILDLSGKIGKTYQYIEKNNVKKTAKYEDSGMVYVRLSAVKEDTKNKTEGAFPGHMSDIAITILEKEEQKPSEETQGE